MADPTASMHALFDEFFECALNSTRCGHPALAIPTSTISSLIQSVCSIVKPVSSSMRNSSRARKDWAATCSCTTANSRSKVNNSPATYNQSTTVYGPWIHLYNSVVAPVFTRSKPLKATMTSCHESTDSLCTLIRRSQTCRGVYDRAWCNRNSWQSSPCHRSSHRLSTRHKTWFLSANRKYARCLQ